MNPESALALERFDVVRYVRDLGAVVDGDAHVILRCPRCHRDKLSVNVVKRRWRCFICERYAQDVAGNRRVVEGAGGLVSLVKWVEGVSWAGAWGRIRQYAVCDDGDPERLPDLRSQNPDVEQDLLPTGLPDFFIALDGTLPYLARRGVTDQDVRDFGLGWVDRGWLANRVVFPVWERGQCVYWQARAMWDAHEHVPRPRWRRDGSWDPDRFRKTLNPSRNRHGQRYLGSGDVLLNLEQAASVTDRIVVTEGPTSCIRVGKRAVATFGKQIHPRQIAKIIRSGVSGVTMLWDGPSEKEPRGAWDEALRAADRLSAFVDVRIVFLPWGDPGDYPREVLDEYLERAVPFSPAMALE